MNDYVKPIPMFSFLGTSLTEVFQVMNVSGLPGPCFSLRIINRTDVPIYISFDGIYSHEFIDRTMEIDRNFQLNKKPNNKKLFIRKFTKLYVKRSPDLPKGGRVYVTGFYVD